MPEEFEEAAEGAAIMPAVIKNEKYIFYQDTEQQSYSKQYGIVLESYYPLSGRGQTSDSMNYETIAKVAEAHGKTGAQTFLR